MLIKSSVGNAYYVVAIDRIYESSEVYKVADPKTGRVGYIALAAYGTFWVKGPMTDEPLWALRLARNCARNRYLGRLRLKER